MNNNETEQDLQTSAQRIASESHETRLLYGHQFALNGLISEWRDVVSAYRYREDIAPVLRWLASYLEHADFPGVRCYPNSIMQSLLAMGFKSNQYTGHDASYFTTMERLGKFAIGQFIEFVAHDRVLPSQIMFACLRALELPSYPASAPDDEPEQEPPPRRELQPVRVAPRAQRAPESDDEPERAFRF